MLYPYGCFVEPENPKKGGSHIVGSSCFNHNGDCSGCYRDVPLAKGEKKKDKKVVVVPISGHFCASMQ
jgi:hypothetical protein